MKDIIKSPELLKESNRDFDFFSFDKYAKNLHNNLKSNTTPTVTTLVGAYGTGKSVLLNEVKKLTDESKAKNKPKWVFFECWQYPDKRDLWEALILELVAKIDGKELDETANPYSDMSGWRDKLTDFLNNAGGAVVSLIGLAIVYWLVFSTENDEVKSVLLAVTTAAALVLLASIQVFVKPQAKSAVSRLSDYKDELESTLLKHDGALYIVLEDVDRAGELGRRFFETVSHFVKEDKFTKKNIKVIVPVADIDGNDRKSLHDSIDKASDNILYFKPAFNCEKFITEVFSDEFLDEPTKQLLASTINPLVGRSINVRKMKHLLRNSIVKHKRLLSKDFDSRLEICIAVEFSKHMSSSFSSTTTLYSQAGNHYEHKPLYDWAKAKSLLVLESDDPENKEIDAQSHFKQSSEIFADIRHQDMSTNSRRHAPIYRREFLISKAYFDDL
ncbi:MAG TPA: P-loop NTPase fold protein [Candidatus Saccharibacteria bacterium]|nr:P-loop NTPase fold protein [Candidatus Saccharibacteria bacterium]